MMSITFMEAPRTTLLAMVAPVGEAIDSASRALSILTRDRQTALFYVLTAYEDAIRLPLIRDLAARDALALANSDNVRLSLEMGITDLVRLIYEGVP